MKRMVFLFFIASITVCFVLFIGCTVPENTKNNDSSSSSKDSNTDPNNMWTWVSGSDVRNQSGTYGEQGTPAAANIPGARYGSISWIDSSGNLWLFGGYGYDKDGNYGYLNDLWKYNGTNWTWVSGSKTCGQSGTYGEQGTPADTNIPGARYGSISWIDNSGNLWLFGGRGYSGSSTGYLNDLWKYDGTNWTWVSGSKTCGQSGTYGEQGTPADTNIPGARRDSISWIDSSGNLWLFGGYGNEPGDEGYYNDLWKYDGTNWTWISGSNTRNQSGTYGTKGIPAGTNIPGARRDSISWINSSGNFWLFGGYGYGKDGKCSCLNDLWKYEGTNWTWVSGSDTAKQFGTYGTKGIPSGTNIPGARDNSISWIDSSGNLWFFGGSGFSGSSTGCLNDLWKYNGSNWTWVSGSDTVYQSGIYGTKGAPSGTNIPGARYGSISWADSSGNFWLFGGYGYDKDGNSGYLNDLWRYRP